MNKIAKYGATGAVGAGLFQLVNSSSSSLKTPLGNIPIPLAGAAIAVGASLVSDMAHAWLLPHINADKRLVAWEGALLTPAAGGAGFLLGAYIANPETLNSSTEVRNLFVVGAASEILGQWVYQSFLLPLVDPSFA